MWYMTYMAFSCIQIVDVCLRMLSHDPNYNYDSDGGEKDDEATEDDMDTDDFEEKWVWVGGWACGYV